MRQSFIKIIYFSIIGVVLLGILLIYLIKNEKQQQYSKLNHFPYVDEWGNITNTYDLPSLDGYVITLFSPSCKSCQLGAQNLYEDIQKFNSFGILFLSSDSLDRIESFMMEYGLYDNCNVFWGQIDMDTIDTYLGNSSIPKTFLYNQNQDFIKSAVFFHTEDMFSYLSYK